ncbi:hypothetical protein FNE65_30190, partial [Klebsiella pneumoniae]
MSDSEYSDEEEVKREPAGKQAKPVRKPAGGDDHGEVQGADLLKARQDAKRAELDAQLQEYIAEWRKQRAKEEDELKRLKEKQAKRKVLREEEDKRLAQQKREEEDRLRREAEEKKQQEIDEKRRRLEEIEKKRQVALQASKDQKAANPNFKVQKKDNVGATAVGVADKFSNVETARMDLLKSKEQLEDEKKISLSIRIKPLVLDGLNLHQLKAKAQELWDNIVHLETEKYDLEERQKRQDYDLKELKERQKQQLRHKALKRGLDPEALTGKYPPKVRLA